MIPKEVIPAESAIPAANKESKGLSVRVEKIQVGSGESDSASVKLLAPFPAKPLTQAPIGWHLEFPAELPPFTREIELSPGKKITLKVRPHLLVPDADGATVFKVTEPGFNPSLGYQQNATVGAILAQSVRQLDDDSRQLGSAIDQLQQLLVSLPKSEPAPPTEPAPIIQPLTPRKR